MADQSIHAIIAICDGFNLILPANMVADVVSGVNLIAVENPNSWQRGELAWQGMNIPVAGFEEVVCGTQARLRGSHIVVLRGTTDTETLPFYGLPIQAMPNQYELHSEAEMLEEARDENLNQIAVAVRVRSVPCVIPDITRIEEKIAADIKGHL